MVRRMRKNAIITCVAWVLPSLVCGEAEQVRIYDGGYARGVTVEMLADNSRVETVEGEQGRQALHLVFEADNWAVARISFPRHDLRRWRKAGGCLNLRLRGGVGREEIFIGFSNQRGEHAYGNYIPIYQRVRISTDWKRVIIPLGDYGEDGSFWGEDGREHRKKFDWKKIESVQISVKPVKPDAQGKTEVVIDLDDLYISAQPVYEGKDLARLLLREERRTRDMRDYFEERYALREKKRQEALGYLDRSAADIEAAKPLLQEEAGHVGCDALVKSSRAWREKCLPLAFEPLPVEERGAWYTAFRPGQLGGKNGKEIKRMVKRAKQAGLNTIFMQVSRNYSSAFNNQFLEYRGWEPLQVVVDECHKAGIDVHAWYVACRIHARGEDDPNILEIEHPDWFANSLPVSAGEKRMTAWLCPARQEYRRYLADRAEELIEKFGFDGFHFDYMRYPETEKRSCDYCRGVFMAESGFDPWREEKELSVAERMVWNDWRERQVKQVVDYVSARLKGRFSDVLVSSAVFPDPMYRYVYTWPLQNWWDWLDGPSLDFVVPMEYNQDPYVFRRYVEANEEVTKLRLPLYHGLGNYRYKTPTDLLDQLLVLRQKGAAGLVFFDLDTLNEEQVKTLRRGPFKEDAVAPHADYGRAAQLHLGHLEQVARRVTEEGKVRPVAGALLAAEFALLRQLAAGMELKRSAEGKKLLAGMEHLHSQLSYLAGLGFLEPRLEREFERGLSFVNRMVRVACKDKIETEPKGLVLADVPRMSVTSLKVPPEVDGLIGDDWSGVAPLGTLDLNNGEGAEKEASRFFIGATQYKFYVGFRCEQGDEGWPPSPALERGDPVWKDNCVQLFLVREWKALEKWQEEQQKEKIKRKKEEEKSKKEKGKGVRRKKAVEPGDVIEEKKTPRGMDFWVWQFAVAKNGTCWLKNEEHYQQVESAVSAGDGYWCVEIGVPFELLGGAPKKGEVWKANFTRTNFNQWVMPRSAWSVTYGPFTLPERFGYIEFK